VERVLRYRRYVRWTSDGPEVVEEVVAAERPLLFSGPVVRGGPLRSSFWSSFDAGAYWGTLLALTMCLGVLIWGMLA
jgi:hypothetical protein